MKRLALILLCMSFVSVLSAQRTEKVTGTYTYYAPENVSLEEAKRIALDRAKINAVADAFGTVVSQSNSTFIVNENGKSENHFTSLGGSEVKGEWIKTTKEPEYKISYEGNMLVVSVSVSGRIREIVNTGIDIIAKVLRNGTEEKYESNEFRNGDDMYLCFKSPIDGYLAVYLLDETTQEVYCLLPYKASGEGAYPIKHDKPYVLFSAKHEANNPSIVDEYTLTCNREVEFNDVYVIFSPYVFVKANSNDSDVYLPRQLSYDAFLKWLVKLRNNNIELVTINKQLKINN